MVRSRLVAIGTLALFLALTGCNEDPPGKGGSTADSGPADASGDVDVGEDEDSGAVDAAGDADPDGASGDVGDTQGSEGGDPDAGPASDSGDGGETGPDAQGDAGRSDGGTDAGDTGATDSGSQDTGSADTGKGDTGMTLDTGGGMDATSPIDATMDAADTAPVDMGVDASPMCPGGQAPCNGQCVDFQTNTTHCGKCGNTCASGASCSSGTCQCPRFQKACSGTCTAIRSDPNNCGSCGNTCSGSDVCNSGRCTSSCGAGQSPCGNECVDLDTDDDNCGSCGTTCPTGKGCTNGRCVDEVPVKKRTQACQGGGPSISVNVGTPRDKCVGNLAQQTFRWAICSCNDLTFQTKLLTDAFDSGKGPYQKGGYGGGIGTNGFFNAGNDADIFGALWTSSSRGLKGQKTQVKQELHSGGDITFENQATIGADAYVEGDVTGKGPISFDQTLYLNNGSRVTTMPNRVSWNNKVTRNVDVSTVCGLCKPTKQIPVKSIVRRHNTASGNNDNGLINLNANALDQPGGERRLELPCGEYYLSKVDVSHKTSIVATGRTVLYIGGDVTAGSDFSIKPKPGAELDVFVAGDVNLMNQPAVGTPTTPAATRFYVGGSNGWTLGNNGLVGAYIYAVPGGIKGTNNNLEIFGGVYTQSFSAKNDVKIHYDRGILTAGEQCPPPPGSGNPGGDTGVDAGTDGGTDAGMSLDASMDATGGDTDGGGTTDPVCKESDEMCTDDSDCCSPLVCNSDGLCSVSSCTPLYNDCSSNMNCCNGSCQLTADGTHVCLP